MFIQLSVTIHQAQCKIMFEINHKYYTIQIQLLASWKLGFQYWLVSGYTLCTYYHFVGHDQIPTHPCIWPQRFQIRFIALLIWLFVANCRLNKWRLWWAISCSMVTWNCKSKMLCEILFKYFIFQIFPSSALNNLQISTESANISKEDIEWNATKTYKYYWR